MNKTTLHIGTVEEGAVTGYTNLKSYVNNPIGISGCLVLYVESGYAIVSANFKRKILRKGMMAVLFYDSTFWVEGSSRSFNCRYVSISYDNVEEAIFKLTSPYFWDSIMENPLIYLTKSQQHLSVGWFAQMEWICSNSLQEYRNQLLRNNIYNLFMALDSEMISWNDVQEHTLSRSRNLIIRFQKMVTQHCTQNREVSFYAEQLCISTTYLYKITSKLWNLSPKELINQQIICEIKKYLSNTDLTIKEIASLLNFDDVPYMCRLFRKHTSHSPQGYRMAIGHMTDNC